jgi:hypothetical protein
LEDVKTREREDEIPEAEAFGETAFLRGVLPPSAGSGQAHGAFPRGVLAHGHQEDPPTRRGYGAASVKTSWESKRPVRSTVCCARQGRQLPELKAEIAVQRTHQRRKSFRLFPPFPPLTAFGRSFFEMHFWNAGMAVSGSVRPGQAKKVKTLDTEPRETRQASMSRASRISMSLRTASLADCHHGALENFSRNHPSRARVCYLEPTRSKTGIEFDRAKN